MRKLPILLAGVIFAASCSGPTKVASTVSAETRGTSRDISVRIDKIWDNGMYNAFTTIAEFKGRYFIAFREDDGHIWGDDGIAQGVIVVLRSDDGSKWEQIHRVSRPLKDMRDPCLLVTPDGRLMLHMMQSIYEGKTRLSGTNFVSFSSDGEIFTDPQQVNIDADLTGSDYLWKPTWVGDTCYGAVYSTYATPDDAFNYKPLRLVKSSDGVNYKKVCTLPVDPGRKPNETALHVLPDGRLAALIRCETPGRDMGVWALSEPPYTEWTAKDMGLRLGGADFLVYDDSTIIAASRVYELLPGSFRTLVMKGTPDGRFREVTFLPSGGKAGDTAYTGMIVVGDEFWVSFYSAHETAKPQIYLAKMPLTMFR